MISDDEIETLALKHVAPHYGRFLGKNTPYQRTEQFRRVKALIADVLSKLRAEGDERETFEEWDRLFTAYCGAAQGVDAGKAANALVAFTRAALASAPVVEPEWIDDPHDIEQGMMRNPKYVAPGHKPMDTSSGRSAPVAGEARKQWPFVESPGAFADRLAAALETFGGNVLPAVRHVLIEHPAVIAAPQAIKSFDG